MRTVIAVNRDRIRLNEAVLRLGRGQLQPPISVNNEQGTRYCRTVKCLGPCTLMYTPGSPELGGHVTTYAVTHHPVLCDDELLSEGKAQEVRNLAYSMLEKPVNPSASIVVENQEAG